MAPGLRRPGRTRDSSVSRCPRSRRRRRHRRGPVRDGRRGGRGAGARAGRDDRAGHAGWSTACRRCSRRWFPGERTAGVALTADLTLRRRPGLGHRRLRAGCGCRPGCCCCRPATHVVLVDAAADGVTVEPLTATDFSRPLARVVLDAAPADDARRCRARRFEDLAATVLAAEAAGLARWALQTADRVREGARAVRQADRQLPGDQAHVRRDAAALRAGRGGRGRRGRAPPARTTTSSCRSPPPSPRPSGIEAAKANAKDCIQVLGGIGITWEHDAHLYLRRAYGIAQFLGGRSRWLRRVAALTQQGVRRELHIDLASVDAPAARDRRCGRRSRRAARGEAPDRAGRDRAAGAALAAAVRPGGRARPSSC